MGAVFSGGTYTTIDHPVSSYGGTFLEGINDAGRIVQEGKTPATAPIPSTAAASSRISMIP